MWILAVFTVLLVTFGGTVATAQTQPDADSTDSVTVNEAVNPQAPGNIRGSVLDAESGKPMPYTNIVFLQVNSKGGTTQIGGTMSVGAPGRYFATLPPGRYQLRFIYLGYEHLTTDVIELGPKQQIDLDVHLKVKPIELELIAVQGTAITNTEFAQLERQRKAVAVQDALSAEQISKSTDSNVAEALERVTGLSVVGGKFVYVRGLGDRYSSTSLNGASLSSPEPSRRTVPLDIFPSAMLDNVVVQKSYTPDMPGEFGGGNIDVRTREAIDKRQFSFQIKGGVGTNVINDGYYSYAGGALDWLGRDDGTRALPSEMDPWSDSKLPGKKSLFAPGGLEVAELSAIREGFTNTWTPRSNGTPVNQTYSGMYADRFSIAGRDGSVLLAGSLSNTFNTREYSETDFRGGNATVIAPRTSYDVTQSFAETLLGVTTALNFRPSTWANISYNWLHTRGSEDKTRSSEGLDDQGKQILQHSLSFVERQLDSQVMQGNFYVGPKGSTLHWLGSYSTANRQEPDRRFSEFQWVEENLYNDDDDFIGTRGYWGRSSLGFPFVRVFGESEEEDLGFKANYDWRMAPTSFSQQGLKFGWEIRDRDRATAYRRFGIDCRGCEYDGSGTGENTFDSAYYTNPDALDQVIITETTDSADRYDAGQQVNGYFAMADIDFAERFRLVGGARYEDSRQYVTVIDKYAAGGDSDPRQIKLNAEDWLPAVNGTLRLGDRTNLRAGYSKTLNRPEMRELSPFRNFNYETNLEEQGNAYLGETTIDALDFRLEAYPGIRRYMAASVFWKDFSAPIERILVPQAAGNLKEVPGNGDRGGLYGIELEWRGGVNDAAQGVGQLGMATAWALTRPFWLLGQVPGLGAVGALAPGWTQVQDPGVAALRNWGFTANYSRILSETLVNRDLIQRQVQMTTDPNSDRPLEELDADNFSDGPLTGQSSYALNFGVYYGNGRTDASLMLKDFGDRLYAYGVGVVPDLYERVPLTLDAALAHRFGGRFQVKFTAENLFDQAREFAYDKQPGTTFIDLEGEEVVDPIRRSWLDGRKFAIAFSWSL